MSLSDCGESTCLCFCGCVAVCACGSWMSGVCVRVWLHVFTGLHFSVRVNVYIEEERRYDHVHV